MAAALPRLARIVNGWQMNIETMGVYGNSHVKRAIVAMIGLGVNAADDAVHPLAMTDADGDPFDGDTDYVLRFDADERWPTRADAAPVRPSQGRPHRGSGTLRRCRRREPIVVAEQRELLRPLDGVATAGDTELAVDGLRVGLHGVARDVQTVPDLLE